MQLLPHDIAALPMPAALLDEAGAVMDQSPEWTAGGSHPTIYRLGRLTLVVNDDAQSVGVELLIGRLRQAIRAGADAAVGPRRLRTRMLAAGLDVVAGDPRLSPGSIAETITYLQAGVADISGSASAQVRVEVETSTSDMVPDAAVLALALKQIVVNARRHDDATIVTLRVLPGPQFVLDWEGTGTPGGISSSRHQAHRRRWGLGFVRLAADALGAVYLAPGRTGAGRLQSVFSIEPAVRLNLPIAAVGADDRIERASNGWVEETHTLEGDHVAGPVLQLLNVARSKPGEVVGLEVLRARAGRRRTWVAIPPQGPRDRARDFVRGLEHEQDLWHAPEPDRTVVEALVEGIAVLLGDPLPISPPDVFDARYPQACAALGVADLGHPYPGAIAPHPVLTAYLVSECDGRLEVSRENCLLHVPGGRAHQPLAAHLVQPDGTIPLVLSE